MEPEKLLSALHLAEKLKDVRRHCTTSQGKAGKRCGAQLAHRADGLLSSGRISRSRHG